MKTYTYDETLALLNSAMESEGKGEGFVYNRDALDRPGPTCHYAWEGKPDCIVGHVLAAVGVPIKELEFGDDGTWENGYMADNRGKYSTDRASEVARRLMEDDVVGFTPKARRLLNVVQSKQDCGVPWGVAIDYGVSTVSDLRENQYDWSQTSEDEVWD